ncbi:MAG TPA: (2Fe-2S)-binding protein [Solirubrobacterales bacterium]|nr:(2Fe-2S)-binding protein [Solirubrobacterales bacterium]
MDEAIEITVTVNGTVHREAVEPRMHAADFLRRVLGLTGTHVGCEQGVCGMCTVLLDGEAVKGCLLLAPQLDGHEVRTVESLAEGGEPAPLQQAFKEAHGLQCGFCTPGMLMTATALKESGRRLDREEIREEMSGVLCRCTGYEGIVNAVDAVINGGARTVAAEAGEEER